MSKMVIDSSTLHDIGNAIRSKENSTAAIPVTRLASRISEIETGIQLPTLSTPASSAHILHGYQALDGSGSMITGSIPLQQGVTITPGANAQGIEANRYLTGALTVLGDSDLVPGNIKKGVSIFNVAGSYEGEVKTATKGQVMFVCDEDSFTMTLGDAINSIINFSIAASFGSDYYGFMTCSTVFSSGYSRLQECIFRTADDDPYVYFSNAEGNAISFEGHEITVIPVTWPVEQGFETLSLNITYT